ncbi:hypothetical protein B0T10DRAFT_595834 [Thelonectria olida]|uniref:Uncharacterized protein n=1 Tax=Thelonectria olida TaxID=1576542 RepID=A0A9P9AE73_9HYPO|nr:hypothetical protein B0T10DRAFT_595834 [Thelonectria olida]
MQFMSQAMGWADCIALAMAPLGIITILVSAIRVGGEQWLRAVIGRTRENTAAAEMELMSSTSEEPHPTRDIQCNQQETPRDEAVESRERDFTRGTSNTTQGIWSATKRRFQTPRNDSDLEGRLTNSSSHKIRTMQETQLVQETQNMPSTHGTQETQTVQGTPLVQDTQETQDTQEDQDTQPETTRGCITVIREITSNAPNITLNLQDSHDRTAIRFVAILGVKDGQPAAPYGFPLAAGGTLLLVFGMFLCALVVENSTEEVIHEAKEGHEICVYWLQQNQTVSDQVFESFATFPNQKLRLASITKSTRHQELRNGSRDGGDNGFIHIKTISGVAIGLLGFIVQFIGLRAMNSAAPLAQIGAVGIMTVCRVLVRPGFASQFERKELLSGFELDWLAWKLVMEDEKPPTAQGNGQSKSNQRPKAARLIPGSWAVITGREIECRVLEPLRERGEIKTNAHKVLEARRELCKLANFQGQTSTEAINLAMAIEEALNTLFPHGPTDKSPGGESSDSDSSPQTKCRGFRWFLNVTHNGSILTNSKELETQTEVWFDLRYSDNTWQVLADSLDAALSLWVYTIRGQEKQQSARVENQHVTCVGEENDQWLRRKVPQPSLRLIGPGKVGVKGQLLQDLQLWAPQSVDHLSEVEEHSDSRKGVTKPTDFKDFHRVRVVGCSPSCSTSHTTAQERSFRIIPLNMESNNGALAVESRDPLDTSTPRICSSPSCAQLQRQLE